MDLRERPIVRQKAIVRFCSFVVVVVFYWHMYMEASKTVPKPLSLNGSLIVKTRFVLNNRMRVYLEN